MKSASPIRLPAPATRSLLGVALLAATLGLSGCELLDKFSRSTPPDSGSPVTASTPAPAPSGDATTATPVNPALANLPLAATPPAATLPVPANPPAVETTGTTQPPTPPAAQPEQIAAIGLSMEVGVYRCELNRSLSVKQIASDGQSMVMTWSGRDYDLVAVRARSGALRYEDASSGLTWITIVGKSLLLDLKNGQQLANECKHAPGAVAEPPPPPVPVKTQARPAVRKKANP